MADHEHCDKLENLIAQIRDERSPGGNTAGRIADAFYNAHYASVELDEEMELRAAATAEKLATAMYEKADAGISEATRATADVAAALATHTSEAVRRLEAIEERLQFYDSLPIVAVTEVLDASNQVKLEPGGPGRIHRLIGTLYYSNYHKAFLFGVALPTGTIFYANWVAEDGSFQNSDDLQRMKGPLVAETSTGRVYTYGTDGRTLKPIMPQ